MTLEPRAAPAREFVLLVSQRDADGPIYRSLGQPFS